MRNLVIFYGPPGSGKSALARSLNLTPWHIDVSSALNLHAQHHVDEAGVLTLSAQSLHRAKAALLDAIQNKFEQMAFVLLEVDATNAETLPLTEVFELANQWRYRPIIVNFSSEDFPHQMHIKVCSPASFLRTLGSIVNPVVDLSDKDILVAIGDIHGNHAALETLLRHTDGRKGFAHIFTGDYINKGPESAKVLRTLKQFAARNPHCYFINGNHEYMMETWAWKRGSSREVFNRDALNNFTKEGYTRSEARSFLAKCADHLRFHWRGHDVFVTHGGFAAPTDIPGLLPGMIKQRGIGAHSCDIDSLWETGSTGATLQIHGHRNQHRHLPNRFNRTFNLEGVDSFGKIFGIVIRQGKSALQVDHFSTPVDPTTKRRGK